MTDKERRESGRFSQKVTDAELLAAVRSHEPAATSEVANEVSLTRQGADRRLRQLRDDGRVNSKKIAASLVWFTPDDAVERDDDRVRADAEDVRPHAGDRVDERDAVDADPGITLADDIPQHVDDANARDAVTAAVEYVAEHGPVGMREVVNAVLPEHPLGYDTDAIPLAEGENYRGAWWRRVVRPSLQSSGGHYKNGVGWLVDGDGGEDRDHRQ